MICGIIPARGGSKGVPKKNIKLIYGKPVIAWTIEAAQNAQQLDDFYVSTDCQEIAAVAKEYGAKVLVRPSDLAQDESNVVDTLKHAIQEVPMEVLVLLQPTSPQRDAGLIDRCVERFMTTGADNLATGRMCHSYEYGTTQPNRQESEGYFLNDGAVFVVRAELVQKSEGQHYKTGIRLGEHTEYVFTDESMHYEIDTEFDFWLVEKILEKIHTEKHQKGNGSR